MNSELARDVGIEPTTTRLELVVIPFHQSDKVESLERYIVVSTIRSIQ